ncbi:MAG: hypothetical protein YHS30scaffold667_42 [Phage 65_10]|nr:MAG: hypothetical protein YHS30scaffold667_42 [Phage 65_10]
MMHAYDWDGASALPGWLAQEKMDGCRAYWTGAELLTKSGRAYRDVPASILAQLRELGQAADCELWAGRAGGLEPARLAAQCARWAPCLQLHIFDLPEHGGPALARLQTVAQLPLGVRFWVCTDPANDRDRVKRGGGEGLMLRDPAARYAPGRRPTMLKAK